MLVRKVPRFFQAEISLCSNSCQASWSSSLGSPTSEFPSIFVGNRRFSHWRPSLAGTTRVRCQRLRSLEVIWKSTYEDNGEARACFQIAREVRWYVSEKSLARHRSLCSQASRGHEKSKVKLVSHIDWVSSYVSVKSVFSDASSFQSCQVILRHLSTALLRCLCISLQEWCSWSRTF